jgi:hypothetical protein
MISTRSNLFLRLTVFTLALLFVGTAFADNTVMGTLHFEGKSKVEKTSGVWIDGQYVGYLKELKGSKKVMLLPGEHEVVVRQDGYQDFSQKVVIQPGQLQTISVVMAKGVTGPTPTQRATVKIDVKPDRAAVFVDGLFVGHVGEFQGVGRGMLIAPGEHHIRIVLPGYTSFETDINPLANQKVEVKTELTQSSEPLPDPLLKGNGDSGSPSTQTPQPPPPQPQ